MVRKCKDCQSPFIKNWLSGYECQECGRVGSYIGGARPSPDAIIWIKDPSKRLTLRVRTYKGNQGIGLINPRTGKLLKDLRWDVSYGDLIGYEMPAYHVDIGYFEYTIYWSKPTDSNNQHACESEKISEILQRSIRHINLF